MKEWRLEFPVEVMARVLCVSRGGFYAWLGRPPSRRAVEDVRLKVAIAAAHAKTRETYGSRRLQAELAEEGFVAGRAPCVRIDVASFKETLLAYGGRNEENDDNLSRRIQSQDHCPDAAAA